MQDGSTKSGELLLAADGTMTGCGGEGTWEITSEKNVITTRFEGTNYRVRFNATASEAAVIEPASTPQSRMVRSSESIEIEAEQSSLLSALPAPVKV